MLDLLAGRYPSEEFGELRPRIVWDRVGGQLRARDGAQRLAVTSGGTIPDRGLFGVFLPDGTRVGELDEEMVYESRPGETFLLGASDLADRGHHASSGSSSRPAPGAAGQDAVLARRPARAPARARPGARRRSSARSRACRRRGAGALRPATTASTRWPPPTWCSTSTEQAEAAGVVPDDRTVVVERFRDEIGDWRVCVLSAVRHAGARAVGDGDRAAARWSATSMPVETMWSDDGIVIRLPEAADELPIDELLIDPDDIDELVVSTLPQTSLFSARFRECAAARCCCPAAGPTPRTPLWQQRQRAADLLAVAAKYPTFPILLETSRECLQDVFDVPALREVLGQLRSRQVRARHASTRRRRRRSPRACCSTGSPPTCTRATRRWPSGGPPRWRSTATCCASCSARRSCASCSTPSVLADLELELQCLTDGRRARSADELHDVLRRLGDLSPAELDLRIGRALAQAAWLAELVAERDAIAVRVGGEERRRRSRGRGSLPGRAGLRHRRSACRWPSPTRSARPLEHAGGALRPHPRTVPRRRAGPPVRRWRSSASPAP